MGGYVVLCWEKFVCMEDCRKILTSLKFGLSEWRLLGYREVCDLRSGAFCICKELSCLRETGTEVGGNDVEYLAGMEMAFTRSFKLQSSRLFDLGACFAILEDRRLRCRRRGFRGSCQSWRTNRCKLDRRKMERVSET
jgi:hypothetical protein